MDDINPFEEISSGLRDLGQGMQQGKQNEYVAQDRQVANEQRQRQLDANLKMADDIGKKPNVWRIPVQAVQDYLRGGYDPGKLEQLMKKEFAPPSPFENANARMINSAMDTAKQLLEETDPEKKQKLQTMLGVNMSLQGRFQQFDANGKPLGIFNVLNDTAQSAVFDSAKKFVEQSTGQKIGPDSPISNVADFVSKQPLFKKMAQEQAALPQEDQPIYAAMLRRVSDMNAEEAASALKNGKVKMQLPNGDTGKFELYDSLKTLLEYKHMSHGVNETMLKAGVITPDVYNIIKTAQAAGFRGQPVLDPSEVTGKTQSFQNISKRLKDVRDQTMNLLNPDSVKKASDVADTVKKGVEKYKGSGDKILEWAGSAPK